MTKIRILPDHLANQIAAGEVVERPASVVKEMVENSLDAGADHITVEIEGGGSKLIRIIDNGCGMDEDDLLMSLERHGTSKIRDEEDLAAINTLGFRGEAVPSIGSVAKLTLISRPQENPLGHKVVLNYGKLLKSHEIGSPAGTTIEVRNLFGNTPARRKFLRTARTELGHIEEIMRSYALGRSDASFILRIDGREVLHFDRSMNDKERLAKILRYQGEFIEITGRIHKGLELERKLRGWLIPPETVTTGASRLRLFVNGRAVKDRLMIHAAVEGLRGFLLKGKNPDGMLHLTVNPAEIDVNVHPAKHEIRFRNSGDIHNFIVQAVVRAMDEQQRKLQQRIFQPPSQPTAPQPTPPPPPSSASTAEKEELHPSPPSSPFTAAEPKAEYSPQSKDYRDHKESPFPEPKADKEEESGTENFAKQEKKEKSTPLFTENAAISKAESPSQHLRIIGVFADLYILCQSGSELVVIDQHAAHERLIYEKLRKNYLSGQIPSQKLLFPETIELSPFHSKLVERNLEEIERIGFALRDFGGSTFVISAIPALNKGLAGGELLLDVLEQFGSEEGRRSSKGGEYLDTILATMACRAAVKANTHLSNKEIRGLLDEMAEAELFSHCPHGRPVVRLFDSESVKKWFYRT